MKNTDKREFAINITALAECFMGKDKPSKQLIIIYFEALQEYSMEEIQEATRYLIKTWTFHFMPKPADFIKYIVGNESDSAQAAWQDVMDALGTQGVVSAQFDEATTQAIKACGGKEAIGYASLEKLTFMSKDFIANYKVTAKRQSFKSLENKKINKLTEGIG